jgi:hypothetical protein
MKNTLTKFFLAAALAVATPALAQDPGNYTVGRWTGGTNVIAAESSSAAVTIDVSEHGGATLAFKLRCSAATTGNLIVRHYRSLDSTAYESAGTTNVVALNGTSEVLGLVELDNIRSAAVVRLYLDNTNATAVITNLNVKVRFKAPQRTMRRG